LKSKYTSSKLVWYTAESPIAEEIIKDFQYTYDADHYNVSFEGNITEFLYRNKDAIRDYEIIKGSMDDVFLNLTGKELN